MAPHRDPVRPVLDGLCLDVSAPVLASCACEVLMQTDDQARTEDRCGSNQPDTCSDEPWEVCY